MKNLSQDSRYLGGELNPGPPEYEAGVLTTLPRRSFSIYDIRRIPSPRSRLSLQAHTIWIWTSIVGYNWAYKLIVSSADVSKLWGAPSWGRCPSSGREFFVQEGTLILKKIWVQHKIHTLIGTLLGWNILLTAYVSSKQHILSPAKVSFLSLSQHAD
jgi:hypothetical protein